MNITDEDRDALLRVLVSERKHRISDDGRGGYRCRECGAEFDWTSDEQVRAKRHEHNPVVDAILASDVFARIVRTESLAYRSVEHDSPIPWNDDRYECFNALCGYDDLHYHGSECTTDCPCGEGEHNADGSPVEADDA